MMAAAHDISEIEAGGSAEAASRIEPGTSSSMSSVVRTTTGTTNSASATAPEIPEKCPIG